MDYIVKDAHGRLVKHGDAVRNFRGEYGFFQGVTRGPNHAGTAKVLVDGHEYYDRVWKLTVIAR